MFYEGYRLLHPRRGLGFATSEGYPAQPLESPLSQVGSRCQLFEIAVDAHENGTLHFSRCRNQRIGRVGRQTLAQENDVVTGLLQHPANGVGNAVVDEEFHDCLPFS